MSKRPHTRLSLATQLPELSLNHDVLTGPLLRSFLELVLRWYFCDLMVLCNGACFTDGVVGVLGVGFVFGLANVRSPFVRATPQ